MALKPLKNEAQLLQAIAGGDEHAFTSLFYGYHQHLGRYVYSLTLSADLAEEVVHDVFLKLWTERERLIEISSFTSYLFIVTRNYTLNAIRKLTIEKKRTRLVEDFLVRDTHEPVEEADFDSLLKNAVSQLPPQQQKVFLLRQQGYKNAEVADQMHISANSAKKYQQWAMQSVVKFIKAKAALSVHFLFF